MPDGMLKSLLKKWNYDRVILGEINIFWQEAKYRVPREFLYPNSENEKNSMEKYRQFVMDKIQEKLTCFF